MMAKDIKELRSDDFYSILLFALFKLSDDKDYSALSRLSYVLDKDNLLKLCKFFGGMTIKVPTLEELELVCNGLLLYQKADVEKQSLKSVLKRFDTGIYSKKELLGLYKKIKEVLAGYEFAV